MKSKRVSTGMSPDAYAGFLRLLLTPASRIPSISEEVEAYLRHANEREPVQCLPATVEEDPAKAA